MPYRMLPLSDVRIGNRRRKDVGDLTKLRQSIEAIGLLHPIVVDSKNQLVVGHRRFVAFKQIARKEIPAIVTNSLNDVMSALVAERDENLCRLDFTIEEAVNMGNAILAVEKPKAAERKAQAKGGKRGEKSVCSDNLTEQTRSGRESAAIAAESAGMKRTTFERAKVVCESGDKTLIEEMNRTGKVNGAFKKLKTKRQSAALESKPTPLPTGRFDVIVADPPWQYDARANDTTHRAANPYPSMAIDAIASMPIGDRAEKNCVLWLWTTNAHLPEVWGIIQAWGFTYKTMLTWAKHKMGTGDWLRGKTEHCLLCVKGKPTIRLTNQTTLLVANSGPHSAKPDEFYEMVGKLCPGTKLELFSRSQRTGWVGYGDELKE